MMVAHVRLVVTDRNNICPFWHSPLVLHRFLLLRHLGTVFALVGQGAHLRLGAAARGLLHHDCIQLYFLCIEVLAHVAQGGRGLALTPMCILRAELQQLSLHLRRSPKIDKILLLLVLAWIVHRSFFICFMEELNKK